MPTMLRDAAISFPMLGDFSINPSASFEVFGISIYYYGAIFALSFLVAITFCAKQSSRFGFTEDDIYDICIWIMPLSVIGARLYYVAFEWSSYSDNLMDIFKVWEGGLAFYGGVIAGVLTGYIWTRVKKVSAGAMADLVSRALLIGQAIGRWANFMNREAFGAETDIWCRMGLTTASGVTYYVHPTFLYESLWNITGFILLGVFMKKGKRTWDGQLFTLYVLWYGIGRMMIEGLRTDSLYLFDTGIRVSQALAGGSAIVAAFILLYMSKKDKKELYVTTVNNATADKEADA